MEIKRTDFTKEVFYVIECPSCGEMIEAYEHPKYLDEIECDNCETEFKVIE